MFGEKSPEYNSGINKNALKKEINIGEFSNLFNLLEQGKLRISIYRDRCYLILTSNVRQRENSRFEFELKKNTVIEMLKKKNILPFISASSYDIKSFIQGIPESILTEDIITTYITLFFGGKYDNATTYREDRIIRDVLSSLPESFKPVVEQILKQYMPPLVTAKEHITGKEVTGFLAKQGIGRSDPGSIYMHSGMQKIIPIEAFDKDGHIINSKCSYFIDLKTIKIAGQPNFLLEKYCYFDTEGDIVRTPEDKEQTKWDYQILPRDSVLSAPALLVSKMKENPEECIIEVIKKYNGEIFLRNSDKKCVLFDSGESVIGTFDYDLLIRLISIDSSIIRAVRNLNDEMVETQNQYHPEELGSNNGRYDMIRRSFGDDPQHISSISSFVPLSDWKEHKKELQKGAPPLILAQIDDNTYQGYLLKDPKGCIHFVEKVALDGYRIDTDRVHKFDSENCSIQILPCADNDITSLLGIDKFKPEKSYYSSSGEKADISNYTCELISLEYIIANMNIENREHLKEMGYDDHTALAEETLQVVKVDKPRDLKNILETIGNGLRKIANHVLAPFGLELPYKEDDSYRRRRR